MTGYAVLSAAKLGLIQRYDADVYGAVVHAAHSQTGDYREKDAQVHQGCCNDSQVRYTQPDVHFKT